MGVTNSYKIYIVEDSVLLFLVHESVNVQIFSMSCDIEANSSSATNFKWKQPRYNCYESILFRPGNIEFSLKIEKDPPRVLVLSTE